MPGSSAALAATDGYRTGLDLLRAQGAASAGVWAAAIDLDDISGSSDAVVAVVAGSVVQYQVAAVALANRYATVFAAHETGRPRQVFQADGEAAAGVSLVDGKTVKDRVKATPIVAKQLIAQGRQPADAVTEAARRLSVIAGDEVTNASRTALYEIVTNDPVFAGYRRVASGRACGACLALMDNTTRNRPLRVHASCSCSAEPVVKGVRERVQRATGAELVAQMTPDRLAQQFGPGVAEGLLTGAVVLTDLVAHQHMDAMEDQITQAPLIAG